MRNLVVYHFYVQKEPNINAYTHIHTYIHTCLHACIHTYINTYMGYVVAQLVEALRYKPAGREFDSR
jgi:hypothetical protein